MTGKTTKALVDIKICNIGIKLSTIDVHYGMGLGFILRDPMVSPIDFFFSHLQNNREEIS